MHREYHSWWSERLQRPMELLVFGHAGAKVLIFPTRDGRFYEYENIGIVDVLRPKIEQGYLQLYCLDNVYSESFYCHQTPCAERILRQKNYEAYVLHEVMPFMHCKNQHVCTIAHGLSLGAYQAASIAFRHPHLFKKLAAFSGRYDLTLNIENFPDLFGGPYNEDIYFLTPNHFLPNLDCDQQLSHLKTMDIVLTIGLDDPFLPNNIDLSSTLHQKAIRHQLLFWHHRAHSASYWRQMAALYI